MYAEALAGPVVVVAALQTGGTGGFDVVCGKSGGSGGACAGAGIGSILERAEQKKVRVTREIISVNVVLFLILDFDSRPGL
jgi:hypothetical protein